MVAIEVFRGMVDDAYAVFADHYEGTDRARFERDLDDKQHVVLLEDAATGELRGFSTIHVSRRRDVAGRRCTIVFSGDTVIHRDFWGAGKLQREFARFIVRLKLRRPLEPLYWFLICKGYRTYLLLVNHIDRAVPRYDLAPPARLQAMLDEVAGQRFGEHYDPASGLVRWPDSDAHEHVRTDIGDIDDDLVARNPHVALFVERNPDYARGDELACIGDMTLRTMLRELVRTTIKSIRRSRRGGAAHPAQPAHAAAPAAHKEVAETTRPATAQVR